MHTSVINIVFPFDINCLLYDDKSIDTDRIQSYAVRDAMREENFLSTRFHFHIFD